MAQNNNKLNAAIQKRDDEYYTHYDTVEWIVNEFLKDRLEDKIIYCNCDSEQSNFVKYFKAHKEELKYKDLWFTSDDYRNHYDLMQKCDIIITNPPFSLFNNNYYPDLLKYAKKFLVFSFHLPGYNVYDDIHRGDVFKIDINEIKFDRPNGEQIVQTVSLITNVEQLYNRRYNNKRTYYYTTRDFTKRFDEIEHQYINDFLYEGEKVLYLKQISDYPIDYYGVVAVPMTSAFLYKDKLDILCNIDKHDYHINGKKIFRRTLCRLKKKEDK